MGNLAEHLPKQSKTVAAIFAHHKRVGDAQQARGYLGASIIGHPCERYLWYAFRACCKPEFDGRMYRLFETGQLAEDRFIRELRCIGCEVHNVAEDGGQFAVSAFGGHFSGHMDACILGVPEAPKTWHVGEFKTHSAKSFAKLVKDGVKVSKPQHYGQTMVYMHLSGMTRALYLAVNKDTDDLYSERIRYDKLEAERYMRRAEYIINAVSPPTRIADRPDWHICRYCDAKKICHGDEMFALPVPSINCRQCCHSTPVTSGPGQVDCEPRWVCERHKRGLSKADCECSCEDHLVLPGLITFAHPIDSGPDFIAFEFDNESHYQFRCGPDGYSTKELMVLPSSVINGPTIRAAKELFGATVTGCARDDILSRYPESDSRIVWTGKLSQLQKAWMEKYGEIMKSLEPVAKFGEWDYRAVEFSGGRVAIMWHEGKRAEIREGIE